MIAKSKTRYIIFFSLMAIICLAIVYRLYFLHIVASQELRLKGESRSVRIVKAKATRGIIKDRNGEPLAISTPVESVWINPKKFVCSAEAIHALSEVLSIEEARIYEKYEKNRSKEFVYLLRHITPHQASQIKELALDGVHFLNEERRFYTSAEVSSHLIGFTDIDHKGQEGLELVYNRWLKGSVGKKKIIKDGVGREVAYIQSLQHKKEGQDLTLSIDSRLQYLSYRELKAQSHRVSAKSASAVVLDVQTGEVLAMVNQPSFNPNLRYKTDSESFRNRAITHAFEPGSVFKALSIAAVLEEREITPKTMVDTSPGIIRINGHVVRDLKNYGQIDVATVLKKSSNIGMSKLVLDLPHDTLKNLYTRLGFGSPATSVFPGENIGRLSYHDKAQTFTRATMAFGYGVSVTPLQLARAYAVLGSGGILKPVSFVKLEEPVVGERVLSQKVARQVVDLLSGVVSDGCGRNAQVAGYHLAGKTGTVRKIGAHGYMEDSHIAVFAGLAPAVNPKFSIVVLVDEPQGQQYYSSQIAAPIFANIAQGAIQIFNIPMDVMDTQALHMVQSGENHS